MGSEGSQRSGLRLELTTGVGEGPTELAAFDAALRAAGIANFNLVRLSSVIPPGSVVVEGRGVTARPGEDWGDRLYVVVAESTADTPGQEAWAGIGWGQERDSGKGLFVEHSGASEAALRRDIRESLQSLFAGRGMPLESPSSAVAGIACRSKPVCALVAAVYGSEPWSSSRTLPAH